jgi:hypothetical protein
MISFKGFLLEAYAKAGFDYEVKIANILKKKGLMPKNAKTAGSSGSEADATIKGCSLEIKLNKAAGFGQAELKYVSKIVNKKEVGGWQFSPQTQKKYPATVKVLTDAGMLDRVKAEWGVPTGDYNTDLKAMGNKYIENLPTNTIAAHYAKDRKTPYIQIGGYGLYKLTSADPCSLGVPVLKPTVYARARVKYRTNTSYGFLVMLGVRGIGALSNYDIDSPHFPKSNPKNTIK